MTRKDYLRLRPNGVTTGRSAPDKSGRINNFRLQTQLKVKVIVVVYVPAAVLAGGVRVRVGNMS